MLAVGWQPSVVRAGVAGALASLAWLAARPTDRWHFLALGAFVLMAWMPTSLLEPGFQLSFAAVAAIFVAVPRVRRRLDGYPVPTVVADAVSVALACGVVTAPIVLFHFGEAPLYTVLANVVAFVAAPLVLGLGLLAAVVDPVSPGAAAGLAALAGWAAAWLELVARVVADLPRAQVDTRTLATVAAIGAAIVARRSTATPAAPARGSVLVPLALGGVVVVASTAWLTADAGEDMGSTGGPSRDLPRRRSGRRRSARDTSCPRSRRSGPTGRQTPRRSSSTWASGRSRLSSSPIRSATTSEGRPTSCAASTSGRCSTRTSRRPGPSASRRFVPHELTTYPCESCVRARPSGRADSFCARSGPPTRGRRARTPTSTRSSSSRRTATTDVFLPADAESDVTARLSLPEVEILKVAHHGSEDPGLADTLRELRPRVAVISCGRNNDYGHPRAETVAALESAPGLALYRTDEDGRVVVESDGRRLTVRTER